MDVTHYKFEMHDGLPPAGQPGQFFGFNKDGAAFILRRQLVETGAHYWLAIGWEPESPEYAQRTGKEHRPLIVMCRDDKTDFIIQWSPAPLLWSEYDAADAANGAAA